VSRIVLISPSLLPYSSAISDVTLCFTPFKKCCVLRVRVRVRVRTRVGAFVFVLMMLASMFPDPAFRVVR
jgi:hypothetical protein